MTTVFVFLLLLIQSYGTRHFHGDLHRSLRKYTNAKILIKQFEQSEGKLHNEPMKTQKTGVKCK